MRRYQFLIITFLVLSTIYIVLSIAMVSARAAQGPSRARQAVPGDATAVPTVSVPQPEQSTTDLATRVYENAVNAANAAEDAQRYAEDASSEVGKHLDTANDLLGLFQNVTAIVGILIPILAIAGGYLGFNQLNEAQRNLEDARANFEREVQEKQAELQTVREALVNSADEQRQNVAQATLALSLLPLGERQYRIGDYDGAIDAYRRALELDPDSIIVHYRLGYVYTQSGKLDEAQGHLTRALEIEKDFAPALACLGYVYRRIGEKMPQGVERNLKLDQASTLLLQALKISPKLIDEEGESWWGSLGGLYRRRGQVDEAMFAYQKVAESTPNSSYAYGNLALLYAQKNDVDAMVRMYERMEPLAWGEVQGKPDNYWGFADLLSARLALGRVEKAEEALASVFRTMPGDSPYAAESLVETLQRLQQALGEARSKHIQPFIDRIREHVAFIRHQAPPA